MSKPKPTIDAGQHLHIVQAVISKLALPAHLVDDAMGVGSLALTACARTWRPDAGASFRTYAWARVRGAILDDLNRNSKHKAVRALHTDESKLTTRTIDRGKPDTGEIADLTADSPDDACELSAERERVSTAIASLPEDQQRIVNLLLAGRPMAEIANDVGLSRRTTQRRLADARSALDRALGLSARGLLSATSEAAE